MIYIVGMHRSGTSLIANILRDAGVEFGEDYELLDPQSDNPEGFCEHKEVVTLNDKLLESLDGTWFNPPLSLTLDFEQKDKLIRLRKNLLSRSINGVKDPRISLFVKEWCRSEDKLIVCIRNPVDVASSLKERNDFPEWFSSILWVIYNNSIFDLIKKRDCQIVDYDNLINNRSEEIKGVSEYLGLPFNQLNMVASSRVKNNRGVKKNRRPVENSKWLSLSSEWYEKISGGDFPELGEGLLKEIFSMMQDMSVLVEQSEKWKELAREHAALRSSYRKVVEINANLERERASLAHLYENEVEEHRKVVGVNANLEREHLALRVAHENEVSSHHKLVEINANLEREHLELARAHENEVELHRKLVETNSSLEREHLALARAHENEVELHRKLIEIYSSLERDHLALAQAHEHEVESHRKLHEVFKVVLAERDKLLVQQGNVLEGK